MSDDEVDVQVCEICEDILMGAAALKAHMAEQHSEAAGEKRSRSRSKDREGKKMKKHKHKDRSRSREKDRHKDRHRDKDRPMDDFIDDADAKKKDKDKKFREAESYHRAEYDDYDPVAPRKAFPSQGTVTAHENVDGPQCFKCGQICKDNALLKNHVLSHYYQDFYRVTPDCKPFACPDCGKENRDRITMIRHYAYTHNMIHELTDVTPADIGSSGRGGRGAVTALHKPRGDKKEKEVKRYNDSDDDDKKFKERLAQGATTFGKHPKEHKHKKEKKNKEHKKDETEEERRIRKDKKRAEKDKDRSDRKSKDGAGTALSSMLKELTPESPGPGDSRRRIAHAPLSRDNSPEREEEPAPGPGQPAAGQEDESDDDFGDLPAPVFAE